MKKEYVQYLKMTISIVFALISLTGIYSWFTTSKWLNPESIWYLIPLSNDTVSFFYLTLYILTFVLAISIWVSRRNVYLVSYILIFIGLLASIGIALTSILRSQNSTCGCNLLGGDPYLILVQLLILLILTSTCLFYDRKSFSKFSI